MSQYENIITSLKASKDKFDAAVEKGLNELNQYENTVPNEFLPNSYSIEPGSVDWDAYETVVNSKVGEIISDNEDMESSPYLFGEGSIGEVFNQIAQSPWLEELSGLVEEFMEENDLHYIMSDGEEYGIDYEILSEQLSVLFSSFCEANGCVNVLKENFYFLPNQLLNALQPSFCNEFDSVFDNEDGDLDLLQSLMRHACMEENDDFSVNEYREEMKEWQNNVHLLFDSDIHFFDKLNQTFNALTAFENNLSSYVKEAIIRTCKQ